MEDCGRCHVCKNSFYVNSNLLCLATASTWDDDKIDKLSHSSGDWMWYPQMTSKDTLVLTCLMIISSLYATFVFVWHEKEMEETCVHG